MGADITLMRLLLRPHPSLWPLSSFVGLTDLKTGVTIALLFALLNKVAGVYGLIAVLTGAGGSFAQLSLYIYSVIALVALTWGLRAVKDVRSSLFLALFALFFTASSPGGSKADPLLCPPFCCRSCPLHSLDHLFHPRLVGLDPSRWQASGKLASTGGHDANSQYHPPPHSGRTPGRRHGHLEPREGNRCHCHPDFLALQGNASFHILCQRLSYSLCPVLLCPSHLFLRNPPPQRIISCPPILPFFQLWSIIRTSTRPGRRRI